MGGGGKQEPVVGGVCIERVLFQNFKLRLLLPYIIQQIFLTSLTYLFLYLYFQLQEGNCS